MTFRCYADNVLLELEPLETETKSGLSIVQHSRSKRGIRTGIVRDSGPGYWGRPTHAAPGGVWHPNEVKPGDRVIVDALAGQDYTLDLNAPRQNKGAEWQALHGERGDFRMVRHDEIAAVVERGVEVS